MQMDFTSPLSATKARHDQKAGAPPRECHGSERIFSESMSKGDTREGTIKDGDSLSTDTSVSEAHGAEQQTIDSGIEPDTEVVESASVSQDQVFNAGFIDGAVHAAAGDSLVDGSRTKDGADLDHVTTSDAQVAGANAVPPPALPSSRRDVLGSAAAGQAEHHGRVSAEMTLEDSETLRPQPSSGRGSDAVGNGKINGTQASLTGTEIDLGGDQAQDAMQDSPDSQGESLLDFDALATAPSSLRPASNMHDTAAATDARTRNLTAQIAVQVSQSDGGDLDIHLSPEELGLLKISFSKGDRTTLVIYAERPETLDLLRRNADSLEKELRESGLTDFNLDFRHNDGPSDENRQRLAALLPMGLSDSRDKSEPPTLKYLKTPALIQGNTAGFDNIDIRL